MNRNLLRDREAERAFERIDRKLNDGADIVRLPEGDDAYADEGQVVDLMQVLKERLQGKGENPDDKKSGRRRNTGSAGKKNRGNKQAVRSSEKGKTPRASDDGLASLSRNELYGKAQARSISGRSHMSKQQLVEALRKVG